MRHSFGVADRSVMAFLLCSSLAVTLTAQTPLGTAFTYQGRLTDAGLPANANYDLQFKLFDAAAGGVQAGSTLTRTNVAVSAGLFTVSLDFGAVFAGSKRFLEIGVRPGGSAVAFTLLAVRQELTPSPNAAFASTAATAASSTTVASLTCANTQVLKWSGPGWTCGADADTNSGGTVTGVTAGVGLSGGTITGTGSIAVATGGITSTMIANGAVGSAQVDQTQVQRRVSGGCATGATIQSINPDGTANCLAVAPPPWATQTVLDYGDKMGQYTSIAIGPDGFGLISYRDGLNNTLKVAHCLDTPCTTATAAVIDVDGAETSIAIGSDGRGLISYYDSLSQQLRVAHCVNAGCSAANTNFAFGYPNPMLNGRFSSIAIGSDGRGLISHYDHNSSRLNVAHCMNSDCTFSNAPTVLDGPGAGHATSITIGADGRGLISYWDWLGGRLKVAHCSDVNCSAATTVNIDDVASSVFQPVPGAVSPYPSITTGSDGLGLISYHDNRTANRDLKVAHCSDAVCSTATITTLDSTGIVGEYSLITIGSDGLGVISYYDRTNGALKVAHCSNTNCTAATLTDVTVVDGTPRGLYTSIIIGTDGLPLISYHDATVGNGILWVAHCGNVLCTPAPFTPRRR